MPGSGQDSTVPDSRPSTQRDRTPAHHCGQQEAGFLRCPQARMVAGSDVRRPRDRPSWGSRYSPTAGRGPDPGRLLTRGRAAARATDAVDLDRKGAGMWGKRDDMVVHEEEPFNAEPPPAALAGHPLTPIAAFYSRNHGHLAPGSPHSGQRVARGPA
jgi:hypothetical protein